MRHSDCASPIGDDLVPPDRAECGRRSRCRPAATGPTRLCHGKSWCDGQLSTGPDVLPAAEGLGRVGIMGTRSHPVPPAGCRASRSYPSSGRYPGSHVPTISLYYGYNVVEIRPGSPPRTRREALQINCGEPYAPLPAGIQLLGFAAVGCLIENRGSVEVLVVALYNLEGAQQEAPDHELVVSLMTTRNRLADDLRVFKAIARDIRVCTPDWAKEVVGRSPCPLGVGWW